MKKDNIAQRNIAKGIAFEQTQPRFTAKKETQTIAV